MRKPQLTILICSLFFASCSRTIYTYTGIMGNNTQTEVNAKLAGVELTGSRTITNVAIDLIQNDVRVIVTYSATIIEFTN